MIEFAFPFLLWSQDQNSDPNGDAFAAMGKYLTVPDRVPALRSRGVVLGCGWRWGSGLLGRGGRLS